MASRFPSTDSAFEGSARLRSAALSMAIAVAGCASESALRNTADGSAGKLDGSSPDASGSEAREASSSGVTPAPEGRPYQTIAEWHLFTDPVRQAPAEGVVPYDVISQLFADYAYKRRFIFLPPGEKIGYSASERWSFPLGTILVKTFSYLIDGRDPQSGERLLETRLLIHESSGWVPHTYVWSAAQTEATLQVAGATIDSTVVDDCRTCHGKLGSTSSLGGRTLQLDREHDYGSGPESQIDHLSNLGLFDRAPEPPGARVHLVDPFGQAPLFERVRSYFDGNCSHCHQPGNSAGSLSGFWLDYASTDATMQPSATWGICKQPASAGGATCGRQFDIVPGKPDDSILICRMESTLAKVKMPPVGRNLVHAEAVALLREWIAQLPGRCGAPSKRDAGSGSAEPRDSSTSDAASGSSVSDASD